MNKKNSKTTTPIKQFALFVRKAKQLRKHTCFDFLSNYKSSISITWEQNSDVKISNLTKPEENPYRSYLIDFRQFLLNESDTQINKILNMAITRARHTALQEKLVELKNDLKKINKYLRGIKRTIDGEEIEISGSDLSNLWLNGTIFHYDAEAVEIFSSLGILIDLTEVDFAKYIGLYSNFIIHLSDIIESSLETNGFDVLNKLSPHFNADFTIEIKDKANKSAIIRFWEGTRKFPQTLTICEIHDQDTIIALSNVNEANENIENIEETKVELKSCCKDASENALKRIHHTLAWIDYLEKHGTPEQDKPITILEIPVTDAEDIQIIKAALDDYRLIWRRKVGAMRCSLHQMPPGVRGFGVDLFMQGNGSQNNSVFLQGCCREFIQEFFSILLSTTYRTSPQRQNYVNSHWLFLIQMLIIN